ncbi:MAG: PapB/FocB family fimbrial expression transcriptional regulator [Reinekea sp.]|nr:PapB/FocB family fimbrial expression transcriptional regulator [Reinekea sp.]
MKYLIQGGESAARFDLLISLTKLGENAVSALRDHLVVGLDDSTAASLNGLNKSNFSRALATLNTAAETVEKIKEIDWSHLNKSTK